MANTVTKSNELAKNMCAGGYRYLYGAKGESYTTALVNKLAKAYPSVFTASLKKEALKDADKGYKAIDCSGFICDVLGISDIGSAQMKSTAVKTYSVKEENAKPGMVLWKSGHVAYVGEDYKIYEARSTASDMQVSTWASRASAFTSLIIVKGSALASATATNTSGTASVSTKKTYTGTFPTLPPRGYYMSGDGMTTLTNYTTQIKRLQQFLNWAVDAGLTVDGKFGSATEAAVKAFQKKYGLTVDGKFGSKSLAKAKTVKK